MGLKLKGDKTLYVDCDDTLIMWNLSEYRATQATYYFEYKGNEIGYIRNQRNINLVTKFAKLGYTIIVWSQTGSDWAEAVGRELEIDKYVAVYLTKPTYHLDDLPSTAWCGERLWRAPT